MARVVIVVEEMRYAYRQEIGYYLPPSRGENLVAQKEESVFSPPRRDGKSPRLIQNSKTTHAFITVLEVQWLITKSIMSTSSHKRTRRSQKAVRKAFGTRSASAPPYTTQNPDDSRPIAETTPAPQSQEANTDPVSTGNATSSVALLPSASSGVPYETRQICPTQPGSNGQPSNRSEPSSTRAMDSSISSVSTTPRFHAIPPPVFQPFTLFPTVPPQRQTTTASASNNSNTSTSVQSRVLSSSFHVLHRRDSIGLVQFGTQSSPPKPMNVQSPKEADASTPAGTLGTERNEQTSTTTMHNNPQQATTPYTVATAAAPPTAQSTGTDSSSSLELLGSGLNLTRRPPTSAMQPYIHPYLKLQVP